MPVSSLSVFPVFAIIAAVLAVGATIAAFIFLLPEAKRPKLNKFLGTVSDILNFKTLFIEKILKALYVFATAFALIFGFLMLFSFVKVGGYWGTEATVHWYGYYGLLIMVGGPIAIRLAYEVIMLFILLVKNVMDINKKLSAGVDCSACTAAAPAEKEEPKAEEPKVEPEPEPLYRFCTVCGTRYDANKGGCPNGCQQH